MESVQVSTSICKDDVGLQVSWKSSGLLATPGVTVLQGSLGLCSWQLYRVVRSNSCLGLEEVIQSKGPRESGKVCLNSKKGSMGGCLQGPSQVYGGVEEVLQMILYYG